jgi:predicted nucleic acid-binding protein
LIAIDTSSWIAFLSGDEDGPDTTLVDRVLRDELAVVPPAVLAELLSDPRLSAHLGGHFSHLPVLEVQPGYWERVGRLRARILAKKHRARLADALIAQSCIDADTSLITRDDDFRWFTRHGGLKTLP